VTGGGARRLGALLLASGLAAGAAAAQEPSPPAEAPEAERARVAGVTLRLPATEEGARKALEGLIALAKGDVLSARALRRSVQLLWQTGRCRNVVARERAAEAPAGSPAGPGAAWVTLDLECLAVRKLRRVEVTEEERPAGAAPILDATRRDAAAGLRAGEPWEDADLPAIRERIAAAYARRGWRSVRVDGGASGEADVVLRLAVRPGSPTLVGSVSVDGPDAATAAPLLGGLKTRPGAVLDEEVLAEDARGLAVLLRRTGRRRAHVGAPLIVEGAKGAEVAFPVMAGPPMRLAIAGSEALGAGALEVAMGLGPDDAFDPPSLDLAAGRLRAFYRARGFAAASVSWREAPRSGGVDVTVRVDEGRRYRLDRVAFAGATFRGEDWLRETLLAHVESEGGAPDTASADRRRELLLSVPGARTPREPPEPLAVRDRWDEGVWEKAVARIVDWYRNEGFLDARHAGTRLELDRRRGTLDVTVQLEEGARTFVEAISFEGNAAVSLPDLARQARLAPGDPLSWEAVENTRDALLRLYAGRGFLYARVEAREAPGTVPGVAGIVYRVDEGPRVKLGRIVVTGNRRTDEDVIRRALRVAEAEWYDPQAIARSQAALLRLGVFRSVALRLREPEVPEAEKDLTVELSERPWQTLAPGVGFSIANGPRAFVEWQRPNLMGRAVELAVRAKVNYPLETFRPDMAGVAQAQRFEGRADAGLRFPSLDLIPLPLSARLDAIGERLNRRAYRLTRGSTIAGLDLALTGQAALSLQYEVEIDQIEKGQSIGFMTQADLERLRFDEGVTTLQSIRPAFTLDYRDNSTHPHKGWFGAGSVEWARSLGSPRHELLFGLVPGSDIHSDFLKVQGTLSGYLPVGGGTTLALSARAGRVIPLDPTSRTIVPRRFFLGGASTMRGWAEEEMIEEDMRGIIAEEARACATNAVGVGGCTERGLNVLGGGTPVSEGGEAFVLFKAEVRLPLKGSLEAGFFVDMGNLWLNPHDTDLTRLRTNVGLGLRFVTPIGPAALDVGFNVTPDERLHERVVAPHFTVGLF
jgi:outer membrane protein assembly complex protein YaeT